VADWERYYCNFGRNAGQYNVRIQHRYSPNLYPSRLRKIHSRSVGVYNYPEHSILPLNPNINLSCNAQKLTATINTLKDELEQEKKHRTHLISEKLELKEELTRRALLAETMSSRMEKEFKYKKLKLQDEIQLKE